MENKEMHVMQKDYIFFGGSCILFGIFYTLCMYDNIAGIGFPICVAGGIILSVLFLRKLNIPLKKDSFFYYIGMLLLGISVCLTSNGFFHFFNRIGIILLFCAVMIHQIYDDKMWGFLIYAKRMVIFWFQCIGSVFKPFQHAYAFLSKKNVQTENGAIDSLDHAEKNILSVEKQEKKLKRRSVLIGVSIAVMFLLVVFPLLLQSD